MLKLLKIVTVFVTFASMDCRKSNRRIMGGEDAKPGEMSYVVRIENFDLDIREQLHCCTGSLVKPQWVLVAAHCEICTRLRRMRVRYGDVDAVWNATNTYSDYKRIIKHPGYKADPYHLRPDEKLDDDLLRYYIYRNDIAFFEIDPIYTLPFAKIHAVEYTSTVGKTAVVAGYGIMLLRPLLVDNTLALSQPLQYADVMVKPCDPTLTFNSIPIICVTHKCERGDFGPAIMPGDSGGPLLLGDKIIGVCSYGFHAFHGPKLIVKETGFFTAVSPYLNWIQSVIGD